MPTEDLGSGPVDMAALGGAVKSQLANSILATLTATLLWPPACGNNHQALRKAWELVNDGDDHLAEIADTGNGDN
jgi:hypothetical protein